MNTMPAREWAIHFAKVMLAECSRRRHHRPSRHFYWSLFASAQRSRRNAALMRNPQQGALFE